MEQLEGRTAVITGGASGMGRAFADRFAAAGMKLVVADIEQGALDTAVAELTAAGADVLGVRTDVSSEADMRALADAAVARFGQVNVVCLNAGVSGGNGPMDTLTEADWAWTLNVNVWGIVHGVAAFLPHLKSHGDGHVVITASVAGLTSFPGMGPYTVSKHAAVAIAETLFSELSDAGSSVGVSCLCPGLVRTNILTSERNRPEALRRPALEQDVTEAQVQAGMATLDLFNQAKPPAEVADLVHDAVLTRRFWILTDEDFTPSIETRLDDIRLRRDPSASGSLLDIYFR
jgi:NAD(P)-dependent dehydrogenase (short-subunit alcohol dehydrogenase family)